MTERTTWAYALLLKLYWVLRRDHEVQGDVITANAVPNDANATIVFQD